jgi:hypothetical protein
MRTLRQRLAAVVALTLAAMCATLLAAAPAQATYGPGQPVDLQLHSSSNGVQVLVGRVVGTVQFDDGNSQYWLSLTVCRQSSYTVPNVTIYVNGAVAQRFSPQDDVRRPAICGGFGLSGVVDGGFSYNGVVQKLSVGIEGVHFDGSTARYVSAGALYDNPYN